jgi:hypothetical protein
MSDAITKEEAADIVEELLTGLGVKPLFRTVAPHKKGVHAMWVNKTGDRQSQQINLLSTGETVAAFRKRAKVYLNDAHGKRPEHPGGAAHAARR